MKLAISLILRNWFTFMQQAVMRAQQLAIGCSLKIKSAQGSAHLATHSVSWMFKDLHHKSKFSQWEAPFPALVMVCADLAARTGTAQHSCARGCPW